MMQNYLDAMTLCKFYGYPDLFITFTCNPNWPEISRFMAKRFLKSEYRPDVISRVFKIKLNCLMKEIKDDHIFGRVRGKIDKYISSEIPNKDEDPELYQLVTDHMMHGPCGADNPSCPSTVDYKSTKKFPKQLTIQPLLMIVDEKEYIDRLLKASLWGMGDYLRSIFFMLIMTDSMSRPESNNRSLKDIQNMSYPDQEYNMDGYNRLIFDETLYDTDKLKEQHVKLYGSLTSEQKDNYFTVMNAVDNDKVDEASMVNRHCYKAFDRTLRDICRIDMTVASDKTGRSQCHDKCFVSLAKVHYFEANGKHEEKSILAPTHEMVDIINQRMLSLLIGDEKDYKSSDSICLADDDSNFDDSMYTADFLNGVRMFGIPHHSIKLKIGTPIMLMHNIDQRSGLCNGTRLQVLRMGENIIEAKIITGTSAGTICAILCMIISLTDTKMPFKLNRRQFPIQVCFAMTINKSQEQTLSQVGLFLRRPVFSHGQLYVAVSRVKSKKGLKVLCSDNDGEIVLNVASSGIATLLLEGRRTAHSRFAIPINVVEDSMFHIADMEQHNSKKEIQEFANWILDIGNGKVGGANDGVSTVIFPDNMLIPETDDDVGDEKDYKSSDSICLVDDDSNFDDSIYTTDFLNGVRMFGIPHHSIKLKIGTPIMLMHNIDQRLGLCNGTRLQVLRMGENIIEAKIITGTSAGTICAILYMIISPTDTKMPFKLNRCQFPIQVCFAMTINKSQGQTLSQKSNHPFGVSTTFSSYSSLSLTPFGTSDSLLEEFANELTLLDPFLPGNEDDNFDLEADLREIEYLLYRDPSTDSSPKTDIGIIDPILKRFTNKPALIYSFPSGDDDDDLFDFMSDNEEWKKLLDGDHFKDIHYGKDKIKDSK
nr:ATP-dependent DNA helicase PIF1-like [Tanacetum cinerariifolium]